MKKNIFFIFLSLFFRFAEREKKATSEDEVKSDEVTSTSKIENSVVTLNSSNESVPDEVVSAQVEKCETNGAIALAENVDDQIMIIS